MGKEKPPHANNLCGAKTRSGAPCKNRAMSNGRCRMHGGKSTGVKGNKNAVTTHEYEAIYFDYLNDEEKALLKQINLDKLIQIDNEIRLMDIRLRRMMGRIAKLQEESNTTIEIVVKTGPIGEETITKTQDTLSQIQNIEEAITRVQAQKLRLIKAKHDIEISTDLDEIYEDDGFIAAMTGQVDEVWDDHEDY